MTGRLHHAALVLALTLGGGCNSSSPRANAETAEACSDAPLLETGTHDGAQIPKHPWDPLVFALMGTPPGCSAQRFELYDLKTRTLIARHEFSPVPDPLRGHTPWGFTGFEGGHAVLHIKPAKRERTDVVLLRLEDGAQALDTRTLRTEATAYRDRFFTDIIRYVHPTPETIYIELNDASTVALAPTTTTLTSTTDQPPNTVEIARRAGCGRGYGGHIDRFSGPDGRSRSAGGTTGIQLRPEEIYFEENKKKVRLAIYETGERYVPPEQLPVVMKTEAVFFDPKIFKPAECDSGGPVNGHPAPLLVSHQTNLDPKAATAKLSRITTDGKTLWTIDTPFQLEDPVQVRWYDSTLFAYRQYKNLALWIDLDQGKLIQQLDLTTR
ncbi:MAG: hypothetical protein AAF799_42115 [Myxococcota bacterium]